MSDFLNAILLGLVEGITEFLPVSSTGHLIVVGKLLNFTDDKAKTFEIFIQSGAILAVVILYFRRFLAVFDFNATNRQSFAGLRAIVRFALACGPFFILGALFGHTIKEHFFDTTVVAYAFIAGGIVMWLVEKKNYQPLVSNLEQLSYRNCLIIGIAQCAALWPGISRSGATIVGALLSGVSRGVAAEFSFLVAVPILMVATGYDLLKSIHFLNQTDIPIFIAGFAMSFFSAIFAVKGFISIMQRWTLKPFAIYRVVIGIIILSCMS